MRARIAATAAILLVGCVQADGKLEPNASPNNANNVSPNNANNVSPNNANNVSPNSRNIAPNVAPNVTSRPFVDLADFDNSCQWDSECELTGLGGDVCGCGLPCGASVATAAIPDIEATIDEVDCSPFAGDPVACPDVACEAVIPVCSSGTCSSVGYVEIFAEQFSQDCQLDTDCEIIQTGLICPACDCSRGAINVRDFEAYQSQLGSPDCNPGPDVCDCEPPNLAYCNEGTCDVTFGN